MWPSSQFLGLGMGGLASQNAEEFLRLLRGTSGGEGKKSGEGYQDLTELPSGQL